MICRGFGQLGRRHISISTKFPGQVGSRLTGQTQTVMPSRRSQTVEVVLAITGYAPNGSTSGTTTATVAHRATIAQTGQPATVLSCCAIRRPSPVLRRLLAQIRGTQAVTHGRFASAVHQSIRSAREPAVRPVCVYCLASFAESSTFTASFFVASTFAPPLASAAADFAAPSFAAVAFCAEPAASSCFRPSPRTQPSCCPSHRSSRSVSQPAVLPVC